MKKIICCIPILTGCYYGYADSMVLDDSLTPQEVEEIHLAIEEWVVATDSAYAAISIDGTFHAPTFSEDVWKEDYESIRVFKVSRSDPGYDYMVEEYADSADYKISAAYSGGDSGNLAVVKDFYDQENPGLEFRKSFMHELGHIYGLSHDSVGAMNNKNGNEKNACITTRNVKDFCDMHECGPNAMATCR